MSADGTADVARSERSIQIPGYEIMGELGRGGMAVVYKARQLSLGRMVALKTILAGAHAGATDLARFRIEAEAVARLQHPNVVQIYEVGSHQGLPYFSLEYCSGGSLAGQLDGTPWRASRAAQLVETLARAVEAAHRAGVVHRDLKPANILLQIADCRLQIADFKSEISNLQSAIPKITDFGLAKRVGEAGQTASGAIVGTPSYMAPEQAGGKGKPVGPAADIYALGAILYELLVGHPPFRAATPLDTVLQVVTEEPVPPSRLQPRVPRDLETVCLKCLEKEPARRYASAHDLGDDLKRYLQGVPIHARPIGTIERVLKGARRRPAVAALLGVSILGVIGLLGQMLWHNFDLQRRIDQALAAENTARREADRTARAAALERLVVRGQAALAREAPDAWQQAASVLAEAVDRGDSEGSRDDRGAEARQVLSRLRARLAEHQQQEEARQRTLRRRQEFNRARDQALRHATLSIGDDLPDNLEATRQQARAALALVGISAEGKGAAAFDPTLGARDRDQLRADCYLLLLTWAESENLLGLAGKGGGQRSAAAALGLVERADALKLETRAGHQRRARYLHQLGREAEAREEDRRAAQLEPTRAVDYYLLGDEHYKRGELESAVRAFENVLRLKPDDFWARYFLSVCDVRRGRFAEAQAFLTECINQQSGFVWLYLMRGYASGQRDQFRAAEEDFAQAERLLADAPDGEARYALYANRGVLLARQPGRSTEAIADLRRAIAVRPRRYQAYLTLAQIYQTRKEWDTARSYFDRAIEQDPASAFLYRNRAQFHLERQNLDAALRDYERAIATAGPIPGAPQESARDHVQRGRILHQRGEFDAAEKAFGQALTLWPEHTIAYLYRAEALLRREHYADAVAALDEYRKQGGKARVEVYRVRAEALARLGRHSEAVEAYTLALSLRPDDAGLLVARGWLQLGLHAAELSLRDFERAMVLDPRNADALGGRGQARAVLGRYAEAVADAEAAVRLGPETPTLLYGAARTHALAAGQVEITLRRRAEHAERGVALLRRALHALGSERERAIFWRERVRGDPALEALRGSSEFARLGSEFSERAGLEPRR